MKDSYSFFNYFCVIILTMPKQIMLKNGTIFEIGDIIGEGATSKVYLLNAV